MNKEKVPYVVYQFWTGDTKMSENRKRAQSQSEKNFGVEVKMLFKNDINNMILPDYPLHEAYQYLADIHKSDYLRSYFMYHFGGGYCDIKYISERNNWKQCFDIINSNDTIDIIGEKELNNGSPIKEYNNSNIYKLLQNGWFIVRPHSEFAKKWYNMVQEHLDSRLEDLKDKPATEVSNTLMGDPKYALRWAEIQGEIFHKLNNDMYDCGCMSNILNSGRQFISYR